MKTLKNTLFTPLAAGLMLVAFAAQSQTDAVYAWTNFVGQPGGAGHMDGTGSAARFFSPYGVAVDTNGNVFVADEWNHTIRKVTPAGVVTTLAGSAGFSGTNDGTGNAARFNNPSGVAVDSAGNIFVADRDNYTIRKVTAAGEVTTLAGSAGASGTNDGTGSAARFLGPSGVAVDTNGIVFVADEFNHTIRKVTPAGEVTTLAGSAGNPGSTNGTGSAARFCMPSSVAVDNAGDVYVVEDVNCTIRQVTAAGEVTTLAGSAGNRGYADGQGSAARFWYPQGVAVDSAGIVYVADSGNYTIRKVTAAGEATTLAGSAPNRGSADGTGDATRFFLPWGAAVDSAGNIFVADYGNCTIRKVTPAAVVTTFAGSVGNAGAADGTGSAARFKYPDGVAVDTNGNVFVADTFNSTIRKVTTARVVTTFAGDTWGASGTNDGTGSAARFNYPSGVAVDRAGNVFVADSENHTIRKVTAARVVTTFAGSAGISGTNDGTGSAARFNYPQALAVDTNGNVFVADTGNCTIRKVTAARVVTTLAGSAGFHGTNDGTGSAARFWGPSGVAVDSAGNVFVADSGNQTIRKVTADGVVTTIGGSPGVMSAADGFGSSANFATPSGIAVDSAGNLYVVDYDNNRISKGTPVVLCFDTSPAGLQWTPDGLQLTVTGLLGCGPVTICVSTNLVNWDVLLTNPPVTGTFQVLDPGATNAARRFYRASEQR